MKVLIMGRTNVGKSSLFNRLIKKRKALVINEKGITRDLLKDKAHWWGEDFELIDSGGLPEAKDELSLQILEKIHTALEMTDVIVMMVDAKASLQPRDFEVLKKVRKSNKPFLLFINKVDHPAHKDRLTMPFYELHSEFLSGSVENNDAVDEIVEWIISQKKPLKERESLKELAQRVESQPIQEGVVQASPTQTKAQASSTQAKTQASSTQAKTQASPTQTKTQASPTQTKTQAKTIEKDLVSSKDIEAGIIQDTVLQPKDIEKEQASLKLFVIGRSNSGKSLLCNQILGTSRMIVSSQAGTTLDTVTEDFFHNQSFYSISDNPGSRRGSRAEREKISFTKSRSELEKADIVLLVLDAQLTPGRQESRLIELCLKKQKPVLLVLNKVDLINREEKKQREEDIKKTFHFYSDLPYVFVSAKTGRYKKKLFEKVERLSEKLAFRVSTSELNQFFFKVIRKAPAPVYGTSDVKFYYVNQTKKKPPEFLAFTNYPKGVSPAYKRFVIKKIKERWDLDGIPIAFHALKK